MEAAPKILKAGEGLRLNVIGDLQCVKLSSQDTNGQFTLIEQLDAPGVGVPKHVHTHEDEVFQVLEGTVEYQLEDAVHVLRAGDVAYMPRGTAHSFKIVGDTPARVLLSIFPAGLEKMFEELDRLPAGPPDFAVVTAICTRYGIRFV
ncbi:Cupin domain-containing protein [Hymenobacter daecheongensis DSM 21074]|uniref:Cupin domain-containing protein n=1 Tax=Hymenobacter daecheongensis DSM 21074 TaxID=1121955 RepID=A0A1M6I7H6_9BACT|nr:cupin domain-containing protein [Hymenobacter daecheongensis]SHJ30358.1 Cupin domain-containing protein [Hymenobacter daecheongensis DSM 21074]